MPYSFHQTLPPIVQGGAPRKVNALLYAEREWDKLKYDLQWKEHEAAAVATAVAWRQGIKKKSDELKKNWKDSVQNIQQNQLAARNARFDSYLADRMERFAQITRDKAEEKRLYLEACDRLMFYTKDSVKSLNAAMVFSEVLRERALQMEFDKKLHDIEVQREAEYAAKVRQDVKDYEREESEKKEAHMAKMKEYQKEILKALHDLEEKERLKKEKNQRLEREDMENLRKEMEISNRMEREAMEALSLEARKNASDALEYARACKKAKQVEEDEEDRVIAVYDEANRRIARMCKEREKEAQEEVVRQREKMREALVAEMKVKQNTEDEQIRKALEERDAEDERVRQEKEAHRLKMVKERKQNHKDYMEAEKRRKEEEKQIKKWETLQRYRTEEVNEEYARQVAQKREERVAETRADLAKQIANKEALSVDLTEADLYAMEQAYWKKEDDAFFKYADEVIAESKAVSRPLYPIERAIYAYRAENNLLPHVEKPQPHHKSSIPFGRAKDKNHMPAKQSRLRKKKIYDNTIPDGQCTCGPILCSCPPVACICPTNTNTVPYGPCTCGPIACSCAPPTTSAIPNAQ